MVGFWGNRVVHKGIKNLQLCSLGQHAMVFQAKLFGTKSFSEESKKRRLVKTCKESLNGLARDNKVSLI